MSDPYSIKSGFDDALDKAKLLKFTKDVYPKQMSHTAQVTEAFNKGDNLVAPVKCLFLPSPSMCRTMANVLVKHGNAETPIQFLLRFCLVDKTADEHIGDL